MKVTPGVENNKGRQTHSSPHSQGSNIEIEASDSSKVSGNRMIGEQTMIDNRTPLNVNVTLINQVGETQSKRGRTSKQLVYSPPPLKRKADNPRAGPSKRRKQTPRMSYGTKHLVVVEKAEERQKKGGKKFLRMAVLVKGERKVKDLLIFERADQTLEELKSTLDTLEEKDFAKFTDISTGKTGSLMSTKNTTIIKTVLPFKYSSRFIKEYIHPEPISVNEALKKRKGRRISVRGKIRKVWKSNKNTPIQNITLHDMPGSDEIEVTLWNDMAERTVVKQNDEVIIKALEKNTDGYRSTPSTDIKKLN